MVDESPNMPREYEFRRCSKVQHDVLLHDANVESNKDIEVTNEVIEV